MINITSQEMSDFSRFISEVSGIALETSKKYLLENRLQEILASNLCNSFHELLLVAKKDQNNGIQNQIIDAMSTNETYFFRDQIPFETLKYKIIPDLVDRKKAQNQSGPWPIRIWSAACSTGQEVYSVIISLLETLPNIKEFNISVLGTDISNRVLSQASSGRYSRHEIERGLPKNLLQKYFLEENGYWRVKDKVRMMASFRRMNLMEPFYGVGPFDIILCRNVSIYFSEQNKIQLFKKISRILNKDGALIVGGSETLNEVAPQFVFQRHLKGIFYKHKEFLPPINKPDSYPSSHDVFTRLKVPSAQPYRLRPKTKFIDPGYAHRKRVTPGVVQVQAGSVDNKFKGLLQESRAAVKPRQADTSEPLKSVSTIEDDIAEQIVDQELPVSLFNQGLKGEQGKKQSLLQSITREKRGTSSVFTREEKSKGKKTKSLLESIHEKHEKNAKSVTNPDE